MQRIVGRVVGVGVACALLLSVATSAMGGRSASSVSIPNFTAAKLEAPAGADWVTPAGNLFGQRHSVLTQINKDNVGGLKQAWHTVLSAPDVGDPILQLGGEAAQVSYKGTIFSMDRVGRVYANDGSTGNLLWYYEPNTGRIQLPAGANEPGPWAATRGVAIGDGMVFTEQQQGNVIALDPTTGRQIWAHTIANVNHGVGLSQAPLFYNGMILGATSGGDTGFSCVVFALDAKTGKPLWHFNIIPTRKGDPGFDTWAKPLTFNGGGAVWATLSVDPRNGLVYIPTGNPIPYAEGRGPGKEYFTDGLLALHISTGKLAWFYQMVHHDVWDFDNSQQPMLYDMKYNGVMRHVVESVDKSGLVFILDRDTGKPIFPAPETKVDQSALSNTYATEPIPVNDPVAPQQVPNPSGWAGFTAPDGKPFNLGSDPTGPAAAFTAVDSTQYSVSTRNGQATSVRPASLDPAVGMMFQETFPGWTSFKSLPANEINIGYFNFQQISGRLSGSLAGTPAAAAASSRLLGYDLATGKVAWKIDHMDSANVPGQPSGQFVGGVITSGGIVWTSSGQRLQAYRESDGYLLWQSDVLPSQTRSAPTVYEANGKEYVTIYLQTTGDLYAFSL